MNSIGKDGGSQIKSSVILIILVDFYFLLLLFDICFLLVFNILFEFHIT